MMDTKLPVMIQAHEQAYSGVHAWQTLRFYSMSSRIRKEHSDCCDLLERTQKDTLDGFEGKLTAHKWAAIGKCSIPTAQRDINDLVARNVIRRNAGGSKNTSYDLVMASRADHGAAAARYPVT